MNNRKLDNAIKEIDNMSRNDFLSFYEKNKDYIESEGERILSAEEIENIILDVKLIKINNVLEEELSSQAFNLLRRFQLKESILNKIEKILSN